MEIYHNKTIKETAEALETDIKTGMGQCLY